MEWRPIETKAVKFLHQGLSYINLKYFIELYLGSLDDAMMQKIITGLIELICNSSLICTMGSNSFRFVEAFNTGVGFYEFFKF